MSDSFEVKDLVNTLTTHIGQVVLDQDKVAEMLFGAFLCGGHVLLEGPPGVAKTLLAKSLAKSLGLSYSRIQFTPDLMPSDITGVTIYDSRASSFRFVPGPLFHNIILADEINRTPPKTQAALLEAMEERSVTVDGETKELGELFFVIATQNPIEHEGTYPLPEAQLDRFFCKLEVSYPSPSQEELMVLQYTSNQIPTYESRSLKFSKENLLHARDQIRRVQLSKALSNYIVSILNTTRSHPDLLLGASPRSGIAVALGAKFKAALDGRPYATADDVKDVILPIITHRLIVKSEIFNPERTPSNILRDILTKVPVPAQPF